MDQGRADCGGGTGDLARPFSLKREESLPAGLLEDADEVHHRVGSLHRPGDGIRVAQVRLHGDDLPDLAERLQEQGEVRPPDRDPDTVAALGQRPHHMASEEARTAEDGDQLR